MSPKLYKASEVCEMAQLQPYVLRSWEKEFPGIGVQKSDEAPRLYRQTDVDQVMRIKQLVFGEGLTLAGARRRIEEAAPAPSAASQADAAEIMEVLQADVRARISRVRDGLRSILTLLSARPAAFVSADLQPSTVGAPPAAAEDAYELEPPEPVTRVRPLGARSKGPPAAKSGAAGASKRKRASA